MRVFVSDQTMSLQRFVNRSAVQLAVAVSISEGEIGAPCISVGIDYDSLELVDLLWVFERSSIYRGRRDRINARTRLGVYYYSVDGTVGQGNPCPRGAPP